MKIGFIGTGNMGQAILRGYLKVWPDRAADIYAYNHHVEKAEALAAELGIKACRSAEELAEKAEMILLAVKPYQFGEVLPQVAEGVKQAGAGADKVIVSIAAGVPMEVIEGFFAEGTKVVRIMPNTPAMVGEGMASVSPNEYTDEASLNVIMELFSAVGKASVVEERLIDAVGAVSGSSPAYVYMFIEALADGAVAEGMKRQQAYEFAAQAVLGSAKMVLETGLHPGELKDQVCSPGGSTIEAVEVLEQEGMRASVIKAMRAAAAKTRSMAKTK